MPGYQLGCCVLVDVNADGHPDLAIAGFNAPNMIYLNNGTSTPSTRKRHASAPRRRLCSSLCDVNGDGFVDMVVANTNHVPSRLYLTHELAHERHLFHGPDRHT